MADGDPHQLRRPARLLLLRQETGLIVASVASRLIGASQKLPGCADVRADQPCRVSLASSASLSFHPSTGTDRTVGHWIPGSPAIPRIGGVPLRVCPIRPAVPLPICHISSVRYYTIRENRRSEIAIPVSTFGRLAGVATGATGGEGHWVTGVNVRHLDQSPSAHRT